MKTYIENINWHGIEYINIFNLSTAVCTEQITQIQTVPFTKSGQVLLYKHKDGFWGLPGGKVEKGESTTQALKRELVEEVNANLLEFGQFAYVISYKKDVPDEKTYNLRYWSIVDLLGNSDEILDPAQKSISRQLFEYKEAIKILNWGRTGEFLLKHAKKSASGYFQENIYAK